MDGSREVHGRVMRAQHRTADTDQHAANMDTMHGDHAWISHGDQEARTTRGVGRHVAEKRVKMVGIKPKPSQGDQLDTSAGKVQRYDSAEVGPSTFCSPWYHAIPDSALKALVGWLVGWLCCGVKMGQGRDRVTGMNRIHKTQRPTGTPNVKSQMHACIGTG